MIILHITKWQLAQQKYILITQFQTKEARLLTRLVQLLGLNGQRNRYGKQLQFILS